MEYIFISHVHWFRARFESTKPFTIVKNESLIDAVENNISTNEQVPIVAKYEMLIGMSDRGAAFCFSCN